MAETIWNYQSGGYEWADFYVYQHPRQTDKYVVDDQSGCSCSSYETPADEDLEANSPMTKAQVVETWKSWSTYNYYMDEQEKARGLEQLQDVLS